MSFDVTFSTAPHFKFSQADFDLAERWAAELTGAHDKTRNAENAPIESYADLMGILGEMAFAMWWGLPYDQPKVLPFGDGHKDFIIGDGVRVDVKSTVLDKGNLLVNMGRVGADVYVLAAVSLKHRLVRLEGFATVKEVLEAPMNDKGTGGCYEVRRDKLHPMQDLLVMYG